MNSFQKVIKDFNLKKHQLNGQIGKFQEGGLITMNDVMHTSHGYKRPDGTRERDKKFFGADGPNMWDRFKIEVKDMIGSFKPTKAAQSNIDNGLEGNNVRVYDYEGRPKIITKQELANDSLDWGRLYENGGVNEMYIDMLNSSVTDEKIRNLRKKFDSDDTFEYFMKKLAPEYANGLKRDVANDILKRYKGVGNKSNAELYGYDPKFEEFATQHAARPGKNETEKSITSGTTPKKMTQEELLADSDSSDTTPGDKTIAEKQEATKVTTNDEKVTTPEPSKFNIKAGVYGLKGDKKWQYMIDEKGNLSVKKDGGSFKRVTGKMAEEAKQRLQEANEGKRLSAIKAGSARAESSLQNTADDKYTTPQIERADLMMGSLQQPFKQKDTRTNYERNER